MESFNIILLFSVALNGEICVMTKNITSTIQIFFALKGHSQLMYMRIRYHFLADLHDTSVKQKVRSVYSKQTLLS